VIDEVDAHLHPLWQQKIVTLLRDRFALLSQRRLALLYSRRGVA
jgi:hypothetical protein